MKDTIAFDIVSSVDVIEQKDELEETSSGFLSTFTNIIGKLIYFFFITAVILLSGIIIFAVSKKIKEITNFQIQTGKDLEHINKRLSSFNNTEKSDLREVRELKQKLFNLEDELQRLHHDFLNSKKSVSSPENKDVVERDVIAYRTRSAQTDDSKELYFFKPNANGYFDEFDDKKTEQNPQKIIYKISTFSNKITGELEYLSGPRDIANSDFRDTFLLPACEIANKDKQHVVGIEMIEPGLVRRSDDKWFVEKKVKIKLK